MHHPKEPHNFSFSLHDISMAKSRDENQLIWDAASLIRLRDGEPAAFDALVNSYAGGLITHAAYIVNSVDTAQDIVQEVFFSLWQKRSHIEPTWDIASYLYGVTRRRAINAARSLQSSYERESKWSFQQELESRSTPLVAEGLNDADSIRAEVWNALSGLTSRCREVFMLMWDHQMTYREIAEYSGLAEQTVRIYASRATRRIAEVLGPKYR